MTFKNLNRRVFISILAASMALTGITACGSETGTVKVDVSQKTAEKIPEDTSTAASDKEATADNKNDGSTEQKNESTDSDKKESSDSSDNGEVIYDIGEHSDVGESTVDPSKIDDTMTKSIDLPDGVANTIYGNDAVMQIVVIGDSQFGNFTGSDGLARKICKKCKANVYNLAIGGTCMAVRPTEGSSTGDHGELWESVGGCGMAKMITGKVDSDKLLEPYDYQKKVFNSCDFSKTDVFVVEYGVNDFMADVPITDNVSGMETKTYIGATAYTCTTLHNKFPNAKIIVCTPTYCQFFESGTGRYLGDYNVLHNDYGTLSDYVCAELNVLPDNNAVDLYGYEDVKIDSYSAKDCLIDGIHMNADGRERYANVLARTIIRQMGYSIEADTNPEDVDWVSTKKK